MQHHRQQVVVRYRELLRLIRRLPEADKRATAAAEARAAMRQHQYEADPEAQLQHLKQLVARISFLRITTPRPAGESLGGGGTFVMRGGELVEGGGQEKGTRAADGSMTQDEARRLNQEHYKRFFGQSKPKEMFF